MDKMKKLNDEELENVVGGMYDINQRYEAIDWHEFADNPNALIGRKVTYWDSPSYGEITAICRTDIVDGKTWVMTVMVEWGSVRMPKETALSDLQFMD